MFVSLQKKGRKRKRRAKRENIKSIAKKGKHLFVTE